MIPKFLLSIVLLATATSATIYDTYDPLGGTCWLAAAKYNFGCEKNYSCRCTSPPLIGTALTCMRDMLPDGSGKDIGAAYSYIQKVCYTKGFPWTFGELDSIYVNSTKYLTTPPKNMTERIYAPIRVYNESYIDDLKTSSYTRSYHYRHGVFYGCMTLVYFGGVIALAIIHNLVSRYYLDVLFKIEAATGFNKVRKYITLSAFYKERHSRPYRLFCSALEFCAPTRGESIIILGFTIINIVFLFVSIGSPVPGIPFVYDKTEYIEAIGFRSGAIAYIQMPLLLLFACRNNWLIALTGWPYSTFQVYHRAVSSIMMAHSIIHTGLYFYPMVTTNSWASSMRRSIFYQYGMVGVLAGIVMIFFSSHFFRKRFYEFFYLTHKLIYIAFFIGVAVHVYLCEWMLFIWICVGIHGAERVVRILKVIFSGFKNSGVFKLEDDDIITVSVEYSRRWEIQPGQYCYLRILNKKLFWQAHPLSIYQSPDPSDKTIQFSIKTMKGATLALKKYLEEQPDNTATIPVFIEGPYGNKVPVKNYDNLVLMAGGVGVTATFQYALEARGSDQKVVFMWVIQDLRPLEHFGDKILALLAYSNIEVQIYVTRDCNLSEGSVEDSESALYSSTESERKSGEIETTQDNEKPVPIVSSQLIKSQYGHIFRAQRPVFSEEVAKLMSTKETLAILSCGPAMFIDGIRKSIVDNIASSNTKMDYFEEAFSW